MPTRITRAQFEAMKAGGPEPEAAVEAPTRISRADFEAMKAGGPAPDKKVQDNLTEEGGMSHGPGTSFALNALDSASMVGLPTVLGGIDAVAGVQSEKPVGQSEAYEPSDERRPVTERAMELLKQVRDRYYKNKDFYQGGMDRLSDSNQKSAIAGQLAPALIPGSSMMKGAKLGQIAARGAASGALSGALRGPSKTLEGDIAGTAEDAGAGGVIGGGLALGGALIGKGIEKGGDLARRGMAKVAGQAEDATASELGKFAKVQQAGQAARRRLPDDIDAMNKTVQFGKTAEIEADRKMAGDAVKNALGEKQLAQGNKAKWGPSGAPPESELNAKHMADIQKQAWKGLGQIAGTGAATVGGYEVAKKLGVDPKIGALVGAGGAGSVFLRKAALSAAKNPAMLKKLMSLEPVGQAVARLGARGAEKNVGAIIYALRNHPEVKKVLEAKEPLQLRSATDSEGNTLYSDE